MRGSAPGSAQLDAPCPLCGRRSHEEVAEIPVHLAPDRGDRFRWVRCKGCSLVRQENPPPEEELQAYYGGDYLPHRPPEDWGRWAPLVEWSGRARDRSRVRLAAAELGRAPPPGSERPRVLDLGCGRPSFLRALRRRTGCHATGLDTSDQGWAPDPPDAWKGLDLMVGTVGDASLRPGTFHLITLWHVLEHLGEPVEALGRLRRLAHPEGTLIVEVPDYSSWPRRIQGSSWIGFDTPRHTVAYDPVTLRHALEAAGWNVSQLRRGGTLDPWTLWWVGQQVARGRSLTENLESLVPLFIAGKVLTFPLILFQRWLPLGTITAIARRR